LAIHIGLIVCEEHVVVSGEERIDQRLEEPAVVDREEPGSNEIERFA
jgi:hypothetical protein